jgi:GNAT superfamily N-acetyltransferase
MLSRMTAGALAIAAVQSRTDARAFRALPYQLYRGDSRWVAPLRGDERRRWLPRHNPSLRERWVQRFLAVRNGRPVGRIAAIVDLAFAARWDPGAGFFGFFECADDSEACEALLTAAGKALRAQGVSRLLGPVNLTTNDEVGLLIEGFHSPPTILSPYNPPFYDTLLRAAGLAPCMAYHAYAWSPASVCTPVVERVMRLARGRRAAASIRVRTSLPRRWHADLRTLLELYNESFGDLWGFVPLTWDELQERAERFRPFYRPELALFAECDGQPVGFALALPDVNEALAGLDGRLWPFGWLRLLWRVPRLRAARFLLLGVRPPFRGQGVAVLLAAAAADAGRRLGIARGELSLVQAGNRRVRAVVEAFGGVLTKTYCLYEKAIAADG